MARAFIAVRPPPPVLDAIAQRIATPVMAGARVTSREQWHLTVQFLGNDADLAAVASTFEHAALDLGPAEIRLGGVDTLGADRRRGRILALGLHEGAGWMRDLADEVERRLSPLGHVRDGREKPFRPHLTLARFREPTDLRPLRASIGPEPVGPAWRVDDIVLYESVLLPQGAQHLDRARFPMRR